MPCSASQRVGGDGTMFGDAKFQECCKNGIAGGEEGGRPRERVSVSVYRHSARTENLDMWLVFVMIS